MAIHIKDASNKVICTLYRKGKAGLNRLWRDLLEDSSLAIIPRNKPLNAYWISMGDKRAKPAPAAPTGFSPLVKPGTYEVILKTGDKEYTQQLQVLKDPNSDGSEADIAAQYELVADSKL